MVATVLIAFAVLLLLGTPVAYVVLIAAGVGIVGSGFAGTIIAQQTVTGVNSFVLLAIPFFIISGGLAATPTGRKLAEGRPLPSQM